MQFESYPPEAKTEIHLLRTQITTLESQLELSKAENQKLRTQRDILAAELEAFKSDKPPIIVNPNELVGGGGIASQL